MNVNSGMQQAVVLRNQKLDAAAEHIAWLLGVELEAVRVRPWSLLSDGNLVDGEVALTAIQVDELLKLIPAAQMLQLLDRLQEAAARADRASG